MMQPIALPPHSFKVQLSVWSVACSTCVCIGLLRFSGFILPPRIMEVDGSGTLIFDFVCESLCVCMVPCSGSTTDLTRINLLPKSNKWIMRGRCFVILCIYSTKVNWLPALHGKKINCVWVHKLYICTKQHEYSKYKAQVWPRRASKKGTIKKLVVLNPWSVLLWHPHKLLGSQLL